METSQIDKHLLPYFPFYPTYEEWKRLDLLRLPLSLLSFYPTYEEWKHNWRNYNNSWRDAFLSYLWGMETIKDIVIWALLLLPFYPTYEEWKLEFLERVSKPFFHFLSYLWGMETIFKFCTSFQRWYFLSYLWGMETCIVVFFYSYSIWTFYPTYEEWKPNCE